MTLEHDRTTDLFGTADTYPRPGWVVLDAARDLRFTGELLFDVAPDARVYLDRGRIYLAERSTDPPLGSRLVDAGALSAVQLEHGSMRIGDTEHLGRLFERVPTVDQQTTALVTELMNDECIAWLAGQQVHAVVATPYRHHPSGVYRWDQPVDAGDRSPGSPLPAPPLTAAPASIAPPQPSFAPTSPLVDEDPVIHWDEPSWLDTPIAPDRTAAPASHARVEPLSAPIDPEPPARTTPVEPVAPTTPAAPPAPTPPSVPTATPAAPPAPPPYDLATPAEPPAPNAAGHAVTAAPPATTPPAPAAPDLPTTVESPASAASEQERDPLLLSTDWAERLELDGLPQPGSDPLAPKATLPPIAVEPQARFEVIWPSGEVDADFPHVAPTEQIDDQDRAGPTARISRTVAVPSEPEPPADDTELWDFESTGPSFDPVPETPIAPAPPTSESTHDLALSMRRAVASIETGALATRRDLPDVLPSAATETIEPIEAIGTVDLDLPGRVATRTESGAWSANLNPSDSIRSVFDEPLAVAAAATVSPDIAGEAFTDADDEADRVSALRRLIGGLRRR